MNKKIYKSFYYIRRIMLIRHIMWLAKRKRIFRLYGKISDEEYLKLLYKNTFKKEPNFINPITYNEKILWLKLHWRNPLCYEVADKYTVRSYVKECGCEKILLPLLAHGNSLSEIDFESLPNEFAIKTSHDSGGVFICKNKNDINTFKNGLALIERHLSKKHTNTFLEWVYDKVQPSIVVEPLIKTKDGKSLRDYKFFCFYGEPKYFFVCSDRNKLCKFDFFDINGNWLKIENGHPHSRKKPALPKNLEEMFDYCRKLSHAFPHVRVDLYNVDGEIYFGELTFFHHGGDEKFEPESFDLILGNEFDLARIPKKEII